jgi:hypothetical protein
MTGTQWLIVGWITALYVIDWILRHRASRAGTVDHTLHHRLLRSELHSLAVSVAAEFHAARKERESLMSLGTEIAAAIRGIGEKITAEKAEVGAKIDALKARVEASTISDAERADIAAAIAEIETGVQNITTPEAPADEEAAPVAEEA